MKVYLGTDHAGFHLKEKIKAFLTEKGYEVEDAGAPTFESADDYTIYIPLVAKAISKNPQAKGIILGGSGQAEAMLANKFSSVRTALFYGPVEAREAIDANGSKGTDGYDIIRLTRMHNDANILSLGARFLTEEEALHAVELWLTTPFSSEARHVRRIERMGEIEKSI